MDSIKTNARSGGDRINASSLTNMKPTEEQLKRYNDELYEHEQYCAKIKPKREDFESDDQYSAAMSEWFKIRFMDAPNEPGYYRANND